MNLPVTTQTPDPLLLTQIQHNCDVSDARDHGIYSMCSLVLKLRNLYKWERGLEPWSEPDSADLLDVFALGKYDTGEAADWEEGDWDGNNRFDPDDLLAAFADGGYDLGERNPPAAVPEPTCVWAVWLTVFWAAARRRQR